MNPLNVYIKQIATLCNQYNVRKLFAFGSVLTERFHETSDVDFLVDFDKDAVRDPFLNFFDFKYALEDVLGRKVDLLEDSAIRNPYLKRSIEETKTLIYG